MITKPWYESVTIWINGLYLFLVGLPGLIDQFAPFIPEKYKPLEAQILMLASAIVGAINFYRRLAKPNVPITGSPMDPAKQ